MLIRCWITLLLSAVTTCGFAQLSKDSLHQIIAEKKRDAEEVKAFIYLANEYLRTNIEQARLYTFEGITLAKKLNKPDLESGLYSLLVTIHTNTAKPDSSVFYLNKLKELVTEAKPDALKVHYNYNASAGLFYKKQGDYKRAVPFWKKAAEI